MIIRPSIVSAEQCPWPLRCVGKYRGAPVFSAFDRISGTCDCIACGIAYQRLFDLPPYYGRSA